MFLPNPRFRAVNPNDGKALVAGRVFFFLAGTSTPATAYKDQALSAAHPQPVELDGNGEAEIWLDPAVNYKIRLDDAAGVVIWTVDNVQVADAARITTVTATGLTTYVCLEEVLRTRPATFSDRLFSRGLPKLRDHPALNRVE